MKDMYSTIKRPPKDKFMEKNDGKTITESAGYISPKMQIENLINAGQRLDQYRREMFDFPIGEEIDDSYEDPTRRGDFDLVDAQEIKESLIKKAKEKTKKVAEKVELSGGESDSDGKTSTEIAPE